MAETILVVDDEESIRELVQLNLRKAGYRTAAAATGAECLARVAEGRPDLVILDIMLPDTDGLTLCRVLRRDTAVPVIFLTARDDEVDRVLGLELGADDYVTKPFSPRELVARVRAVLRRAGENGAPRSPEALTAGDLVVDLARHEARRAGRPVPLTPKEFELLAFLVRHAGQALSRDRLLDSVWGADYFGDVRIVDVHVRHLREKIEADPANPVYIKTVRGVGYRFDLPDRASV